MKKQFELYEEYMKCRDDIGYFLEHYYKINTAEYGNVSFKPTDNQKESLQFIKDNKRAVVIDDRQTGKTTLMLGIALHKMVFGKHSTIAIVGFRDDVASELLNNLFKAFELLPIAFKMKCWYAHKRELNLENGIKVISCSARSPHNLRGRSINLLLMDEPYYVESFKEFLQCIIPAISIGNVQVVITSNIYPFKISTFNLIDHTNIMKKEAFEQAQNITTEIRQLKNSILSVEHSHGSFWKGLSISECQEINATIMADWTYFKTKAINSMECRIAELETEFENL